MEPVILETPRLVLRPLGAGDTEAVHRACQDEEIQRWTTVPSPYLPVHARDFVEQIAPDGWRDDTLYNWGSFTREGGALVSSVGLSFPARAGVAEIGYWTAREHRGRGYTAEAVAAATRWAFTALGVQRLEWYAEAGNEASRAVVERVGFTFEGTLRSYLLHRGERRDAWVGAMLPTDPVRDPAVG
ncbi:GNAT family N-acetyltransferase [Peterkaempfera bronchialis]|uniref:N-acetyltransferase n=1 Tax=Peterkaempfera bronchialis TaxID=2126346 RepID=A0A345SVN6_9ACTN|nr:GNAT family N-acetyltransferase [Peterkaempfera bronchialis]AXI77791.1 N-acetyltransferase [Peterkaempfera bronchialis]